MTTKTKAKHVLADDDVRIQCSERLLAARAGGIPRRLLAEKAGVSEYVIWRAERGNMFTDEVRTIKRLLRQVDTGAVQPTRRVPQRDQLTQLTQLAQTIDAVAELVKQARGERTATARNKLLDEALGTIDQRQS